MAIVINGSGTVTGLAVGGLPDGTVDTDTLANTTVTAAKVAADVATQSELDAKTDATKLPLAGGTLSGDLAFSNANPVISGSSGNMKISAEDSLVIEMDNNSQNAGGETFQIKSDASNTVVSIGENGRFTSIASGMAVPTNEAQMHVHLDTSNVTGLMSNCTSTSYGDNVAKLQCARDSNNGQFNLLNCRNGGGSVMRVGDGGNVINSNNSYGQISDERVKQDIADASSQWEDIKAVRVRKFKLKKLVNRDGADNTPYHIGVVSQELQAAGMTNLVDESKPEKEDVALHADFGTIDSEGVFTAGEKKKEVKYSILYMKSIKALQEAMARIETLEAKVTALENA